MNSNIVTVVASHFRENKFVNICICLSVVARGSHWFRGVWERCWIMEKIGKLCAVESWDEKHVIKALIVVPTTYTRKYCVGRQRIDSDFLLDKLWFTSNDGIDEAKNIRTPKTNKFHYRKRLSVSIAVPIERHLRSVRSLPIDLIISSTSDTRNWYLCTTFSALSHRRTAIYWCSRTSDEWRWHRTNGRTVRTWEFWAKDVERK